MLFIDFHGIWLRAKRKWWPLESLVDQLNRKTGIQLGYTGPVLARRNFHLRGSALFWHKQVMGNTGSGKSELLKQLIRQFIHKDIPFCLIDPHSDLAESVLSYLVEIGYFHRMDVAKNPMRKLMYIDFGIKNEENRVSHFLPFNILHQPYTPGEVGQDIVDVLLRLWPYLEQASPQLQDIVKNAIPVMIANQLPIVKLQSVLKNKPYREALLKRVSDPAIIEYFHYRFDKWDEKYAPMMVESTLNKFSNLLSSDVLRYSLGQSQNTLNFNRIMEEGTSVIFNLGGLRREVKKLLGCLLTIGMENAMYARDALAEWQRKDYFLIIDEFKQFIDTSEGAVETFLSEARKFKVWLVLAHQYLGQLTPELIAALQNTQRIVLKLEDDAISMAQKVGKYNPDLDKRQPEDEEARRRTNPLPYNPNEEYELLANDIKDLFPGEGFIRYKHKLEKFKAAYVPEKNVASPQLEEVKRWYAKQLMIPRNRAIPMVNMLFDNQTPDPAQYQRKRHQRE